MATKKQNQLRKKNIRLAKIAQAKKLFGDFSGHHLTEQYDLDNLTGMEGEVVFAFGRLDILEENEEHYVDFTNLPDPPLLCSSYDGEQLYIIGDPDGAIGLEDYDQLDLCAIEYSTFRDGEYENYRHEFDSNDTPVVEFLDNDDDEAETELFIDGGGYRFTNEGIVNI